MVGGGLEGTADRRYAARHVSACALARQAHLTLGALSLVRTARAHAGLADPQPALRTRRVHHIYDRRHAPVHQPLSPWGELKEELVHP